MRFLCALLCLLLAPACAVAQGQLLPPPGWTGTVAPDGVVMVSPADDPSMRVILTLLPLAATPPGPAKPWFADRALALSRSFGQALGATEVMEDSGVLARLVQVRNAGGLTVRAIYYGYQGPRGFQIAVLMIPPKVADQDPRLEAVNSYVEQLAARKFELVLPQQPPHVAAAPAPGRLPNGDIDLTYHARAIPGQGQDVPLTSVYLNVGFAFGATYGGVGTSMTWGQHAVQQLLLLYANGVAAKVDLRGGNLAGKYQAEGFASLDVNDPAQISGGGFGRWTRSGGAVHIRWNVADPSDLAQNGANLEGKGERWTPYRLADGVRLEGTFVRRMEAGLRSQWIMLHGDGSFVGDGVNVTMGGAEVNPAFPERGGGAYEIRKGSMILRYANGFTQAIACTLDPNGPDARMVLLNGFPFERAQ